MRRLSSYTTGMTNTDVASLEKPALDGRAGSDVRSAGEAAVVDQAFRDLRYRLSQPRAPLTAADLAELDDRKRRIDELRPYLTLMSDWEMGFLIDLVEMRTGVSGTDLEGERLLALSPEQMGQLATLAETYAPAAVVPDEPDLDAGCSAPR